MQLIQHVELTTTSNSIAFSSIPQTYTDLFLVCSLRGNAASAYNDSYIQFNGDSGANYSTRDLYGDGSSVGSGSTSGLGTSGRIGFSAGANATANTFGSLQLYIPNYRSAASKVLSADSVTENNGGAFTIMRAFRWTGTSAITSLVVFGFSTNFIAGSSASLYGVSAGNFGSTTVS